MPVVYYGKVKWFNNAKGYGFIVEDSLKGDVFVHYSSINMPGFKTLKENDIVSFVVVKTTKGLQAVDVNLTRITRKEEK